MYWGLDTFYGVIRIVSKTPPSPSGVFEKCHGTQMGAYSPVRLRRKSAIGNHYCPDFAT